MDQVAMIYLQKPTTNKKAINEALFLSYIIILYKLYSPLTALVLLRGVILKITNHPSISRLGHQPPAIHL